MLGLVAVQVISGKRVNSYSLMWPHCKEHRNLLKLPLLKAARVYIPLYLCVVACTTDRILGRESSNRFVLSFFWLG